MPIFAYQAADARARRVGGIIEAESARMARRILLNRGLRAWQVLENDGANANVGGHVRLWRLTLDRIAAIRNRGRVGEALENVVTLLESGLTLDAAMAEMSVSAARGRLAALLHSLHAATATGQSFSAALAVHPFHFDAVDAAMVRAGEDAGDLAGALKRLLARRRLSGKLSSTVMAALAYPAFLMFFGCGVIIFLAIYVIPDINAMLIAGGGTVPRITSILQSFAWFLSFALIPLVVVTVLVSLVILRNKPAFRRKLQDMALCVPVAGPCWLNWQLSQFCLVLRTLLASGVHLPTALSLAAKACGDGPVEASAMVLRERVLEGHDLGKPPGNEASGLPPWLWRALAVGQKSGDLVPVLERVGLRFEAAALRSAAQLGAVLEPLMILVVGAFVGLVAYAGLLPIVRLNGLW